MKNITIYNISDLNKYICDDEGNENDGDYVFPEKTDVCIFSNLEGLNGSKLVVRGNLYLNSAGVHEFIHIYGSLDVCGDFISKGDVCVEWGIDCIKIKGDILSSRKGLIKCRSIECSKLYARDGINAGYIDIK